MKLYVSPTSPFARKAQAVARLLGVALEEVRCQPFDSPPELLAANPLSKVPALVLDDGSALFDSRVIVQALDDLAGGKLLPSGRQERWAVLRLQALCDGIGDSAVALRMEVMRPAEQQSPAGIERYRNAIRRGLDAAETDARRWQDEQIGLAQIALVAILDYIDFRHRDWIDWRRERLALQALHTRFSRDPCLVDTRPG